MDALLLILAYLAIGLGLKRLHLMPVNTGQVLNQYVINVAVPAMILLHLPKLELNTDVLLPALMPWLLYPLAVGLILLAARAFNWSRELTGAMLIVVPLGNTSFLGFPMVETFFGAAGLPYAVIYDQVGSFIALAFIASTFAAVYGNQQEGSQAPQGALTIAKKLLTFPPVVALFIALLFGQTEYPRVIQPLVENLAATLVPVVMIAVGFQLHFRIPREDLFPFGFAMVVKLVLMPLIAYGVIRGLGADGLSAQVTVLEASMPFMISAGAIAIGAGLKPRFVASLVGYGVLFGLVTVPIWAWLLQSSS
ncbi:MAG: AEC family transporter [Gammaproteobacteria bacterium]|nr:AEC family transporter [Gammaproteobacteria bacterium]